MRRCRLQGIGREISRIGLGTWPLGRDLASGDCEGSTFEAEATVSAALHHGVNFFDTADVYGDGAAERLLGRMLKACGQSVVVCTKGGWDATRGAFNPDAEFLAGRIAGSGRRLGRDRIDIYLLHNPPAALIGARDVYKPLVRAQERGEIGCFGVSVETLEAAWLTLDRPEISVVQIPYNFLLSLKGLDWILTELARAGKDLLAREALGNGLLTGKYDRTSMFPPGDFRALWPQEVRDEIAEQLTWWAPYRRPDESWVNFAMRFVLERAEFSAVVVGARTAAQVEPFGTVGGVGPVTSDFLVSDSAESEELAFA